MLKSLPSGIAGALSIACLSAFVTPGAQAARECQTFTCIDTFYYSNAQKTKVVGVQSTCPGRKGLRGTRTRWFERETERYEICSNPPPNVPCDFRPGGCRPGATLMQPTEPNHIGAGN